ncbi:MAG TPA: hypothetical protein VD931_21300, partial [Baekduia sp.]|nr:hypothetical protein [Baekduia sp.]
MTRITKYGGLIASIVLIAFGIGALTMGVAGRAEVRDNLAAEKIVGTPDVRGAHGRLGRGRRA